MDREYIIKITINLLLIFICAVFIEEPVFKVYFIGQLAELLAKLLAQELETPNKSKK